MKRVSIILVLLVIIISIVRQSAAGSEKEYGQHAEHIEKFYGIVESMPEGVSVGAWTINGRNIQVSRDAYVKEKRGKAAVGAYVEVKGKQTGDVFTAYEIEVEGSGDAEKSPYPGKFYGTVEHIPEKGREGTWIINGREILVTNSTEIEEKYGKAAAGAYVEVEGNYTGKTFTAYEIEVKGERRYHEHAPSMETPHKGRSRDYSHDREKVYNSRFGGTIESLPEAGYEGLWIINGRKVEVNHKTLIDEIDGIVSVGAYAKVSGIRTGDTITAYEIKIDRKKN